MAHHKSCIKRIVTSDRARLRNRGNKSRLNTARKILLSASAEEASAKLNSLYELVDQLAKKNVVHKKKAARIKSRAARAVNRKAQNA